MKSASPMLMVVASRPPTSTRASRPKYTPCGLLRTTCPLALMRPKIWLGLAPITRLSITLCALGWMNCTWASLPTLKLCQFKTARWLLC